MPPQPPDRDARLAVAVRAAVAFSRVALVHDYLEADDGFTTGPEYFRARRAFRRLYGKDARPKAHPEVWRALLETGGGNETPTIADRFMADATAAALLADVYGQWATALEALIKALGSTPTGAENLEQWVGCSRSELEQAVIAASAEADDEHPDA